MKSLIPIDLPKCELSRTGAIFSQDLTQKEWMGIWNRIESVDASINWIKGDWFLAGKKFLHDAKAFATEDECAQAISDLLMIDDVQRFHLRHCAWVCGHVLPCRRRHTLSWSHHMEVASLAHDEQDRLLALSEKELWSRADLRAAIAGEAGKKGESSLAAFIPGQWALTFIRWYRRSSPMSWSADRRSALKEQLRPLVEIYEQL